MPKYSFIIVMYTMFLYLCPGFYRSWCICVLISCHIGVPCPYRWSIADHQLLKGSKWERQWREKDAVSNEVQTVLNFDD